jgi:predicted nucleic-acid-binding Zn-ribbon protein
MKASKQCPKCDSLKVGYLEQVLDAVDPGTRGHKPAIVGKTPVETKFFGTTIEGVADAGELEAYICTACGYYETYVKQPASVPFDKLDGFHWLNAEAKEEKS